MKIQRLQFKLNTAEIKELEQNLSVKHFMHSLRPDDSVTWRGGETSVLAETAFHVCDGAAIGATRRCPVLHFTRILQTRFSVSEI